MHELNLVKLIEHTNSMSTDKKVEYFREYKMIVGMPLKKIDKYLDTRSRQILLKSNEGFMNKMLAVLGMDNIEGLSESKLYELMKSAKATIKIFMDNVDELIDHHEKIRKNKKYVPREIDERVPYLGTEEQLMQEFNSLSEKLYVDKLSKEEVMFHFRCTDSSEFYDRDKARNHRIIWKGPHNHYTSWVQENKKKKLFPNVFRIFALFNKHIIPESGIFRRLSNKYYNVKNTRTNHKVIKEIVRTAAGF